MTFNRAKIFYLSKEVLSQRIDNETVLLDMKNENYFGLNNVATTVLEMLKTGASLDTLLIALLKIYDVEQNQLEKDIAQLMEELLDADLILAQKL